MERIPEPELMTEPDQAKAYAEADFGGAHATYVPLLRQSFPDLPLDGDALDLGCGPGDVTFRFAQSFPGYFICGVDGSAAMLEFAWKVIEGDADLAARVTLIEGIIPGAPIPIGSYDIIFSTSFLHHLHDPSALWETVATYGGSGTRVFVTDLFRPATLEEASALTETYAGNEPDVLKRDFHNSLLAAFTPEEVEEQLKRAGLTGLSVRTISDRHLVVSGIL